LLRRFAPRNDGVSSHAHGRSRTQPVLRPNRGLLENVVLRHDNGVITSIDEGTQPAIGPRSLVLPAFVNAHDHARPTASSFGAIGMPLESWILRSALARLSILSHRGLRTGAFGAGGLCVDDGALHQAERTMPLVEEAKQSRGPPPMSVSALRLRSPCATRIRSPMAIANWYCRSYPATIARRSRSSSSAAPMSPKAYYRTDRRDCSGDIRPKVDVQLGPAGVQWCSMPFA